MRACRRRNRRRPADADDHGRRFHERLAELLRAALDQRRDACSSRARRSRRPGRRRRGRQPTRARLRRRALAQRRRRPARAVPARAPADPGGSGAAGDRRHRAAASSSLIGAAGGGGHVSLGGAVRLAGRRARRPASPARRGRGRRSRRPRRLDGQSLHLAGAAVGLVRTAATAPRATSGKAGAGGGGGFGSAFGGGGAGVAAAQRGYRRRARPAGRRLRRRLLRASTPRGGSIVPSSAPPCSAGHGGDGGDGGVGAPRAAGGLGAGGSGGAGATCSGETSGAGAASGAGGAWAPAARAAAAPGGPSLLRSFQTDVARLLHSCESAPRSSADAPARAGSPAATVESCASGTTPAACSSSHQGADLVPADGDFDRDGIFDLADLCPADRARRRRPLRERDRRRAAPAAYTRRPTTSSSETRCSTGPVRDDRRAREAVRELAFSTRSLSAKRTNAQAPRRAPTSPPARR